MKQTYYLISRREPCSPQLKIRRFRCGISLKERKWLYQIMFLAKSRNCYLTQDCDANQTFFRKLARQIYGDSIAALPAFLSRNIVNASLLEVRDALRNETEICRSVERQLDFQNQTDQTTKSTKP